MKLARIEKDNQKFYGEIVGEEVRIRESLFANHLTGATLPLASAKLLAPCEPSKIVAVGLNYRDHAEELGQALPEDPILFIKPSTTVIGPEESIILPKMSQRVDYEAEVAVVIGKTARNIAENEARNYILGFTALNDVTARDLQKKDGQWTRAKSFDTFCPLGPWIITTDELDTSDLKIELRLNGEVKQSSSTKNLIFSFSKLLSFISEIMTLFPGDVITTGTPAGIGPLSEGDVVEVMVEGIGCLRNRVIGLK